MQITYLGHCCFKLKAKVVSLLTDPPSPKAVGFAIPKTEAEIVTVSSNEPAHNDLERLKNQPFVIRAPGEYEVGGVSVFGLPAGDGRVIFLIEMESLRLAHLDRLSDLTDEKKLEELDGVDIILLNIGRQTGLPADKIVKIINRIEPSVVIPMDYDKQDLSEFLKEYGSEGETMKKLVVTKGGVREEKKVVILER